MHDVNCGRTAILPSCIASLINGNFVYLQQFLLAIYNTIILQLMRCNLNVTCSSNILYHKHTFIKLFYDAKTLKGFVIF